MRGLDPRIHVFGATDKAWMAGTSPAMTSSQSVTVMRGLDPRIHVFGTAGKAWMAGTSPAMTASYWYESKIM